MVMVIMQGMRLLEEISDEEDKSIYSFGHVILVHLIIHSIKCIIWYLESKYQKSGLEG